VSEKKGDSLNATRAYRHTPRRAALSRASRIHSACALPDSRTASAICRALSGQNRAPSTWPGRLQVEPYARRSFATLFATVMLCETATAFDANKLDFDQ